LPRHLKAKRLLELQRLIAVNARNSWCGVDTPMRAIEASSSMRSGLAWLAFSHAMALAVR